MASPYNPGVRQATALGLALGFEDAEFDAGTATKVTSQTTLVITHGLSAAPTFVMVSAILKPNAAAIAPVVNSTSITFTRTTATSSWSYSYIAGVIA